MKTMQLTPRALCALSLLSAPFATSAHAQKATLLPATAVTPTSVAGQPGTNLIDGSGLTESAPGSGLFVHANSKGFWFGKVSDGQPEVVFDLGAEKDVTGLHVWNYNEKLPKYDGLGRGMKVIEVSSSADGQTFTKLSNFPIEKAPGTSDYLGQAVPFAAPVKTRYIRIASRGHYGGDRKGLAEVRFYTGAIPVDNGARVLGTAATGGAPAPAMMPPTPAMTPVGTVVPTATGGAGFAVGEIVALKGQNYKVADVVNGVVVLAPGG